MKVLPTNRKMVGRKERKGESEKGQKVHGEERNRRPMFRFRKLKMIPIEAMRFLRGKWIFPSEMGRVWPNATF